MPCRAVVLMNLGAPDSLNAVRPFLTNLFGDPAILRVPGLFRWILARLIARKRIKAAIDIYSYLGGGSPLLANTQAQARALEAELNDGTRCFIAMRHWHPFTENAVDSVKGCTPEEVVLLPLYPQFSTTTTASSLAEWKRQAAAAGLTISEHTINSYPCEPGFVGALAGLIRPMLDEAAADGGAARLLMSAHGLPLKIVAAGDPYPQQIAETAAAVAAALDIPDLDWRVCYQSRVGPLKWLGPATDEEIRRAGRDRVAVVIAPISFVSEHSETLVELDRDYRRIAEESGVPGYYRVPTVGTDPRFIAGLARLVRAAR